MSGPQTGPIGPGERLHDRYVLGAVLGRGGMSQVYDASDERLARRVAIKVLTATPGADGSRFDAEVRALARLDHPNIVRLLDAGKLDDGRAYLVMELVTGASLAGAIATAMLSGEETARIGAAVAAGLAYVHARGVVHRDVKPANILLGPDERVRLADFGIARLVDTAGLTATGIVLGTPAYLAPEQVTGRVVGPPADLYALGLVLAECSTGRRVFGGTANEAALARVHAAPLALEDVPSALRPLLARLTAPEPAARPSAAEAAAALSALAEQTRTIVLPSWALRDEPRAATAGLFAPAAADTAPVTPVTPATAATHAAPAAPAAGAAGAHRRRLAVLGAIMLAGLGLGFGLEQALHATPHAPRHTSTPNGPIFPASVRRSGGATTTGRSDPSTSSTTSSSTTSSSTSTSSTSTSSTSTSSTSTSTTTTPTTTTPGVNVAAARRDLGALVGSLVAGEGAGTITPGAFGTLATDLQAIADGSTSPTSGLTQLGQGFSAAVASGALTGGSVAAVAGQITALAGALGVPPPAIPTTTPTSPTSPTSPGANGPGPGDSGPGGPTGSSGNGPPGQFFGHGQHHGQNQGGPGNH